MDARIKPDWEIRDAILDMGATDAYKCFQCGLCMAVCPWTHVESVAYPVYRTPQAVKLGALMSSEDPAEIEREVSEIYRCAGCLSCSTWCPHGVSMPDIMRGIRRILVEFGTCPSELADAVSRIQDSGNPFGESRERRAAWTEGLSVAAFEPGMDYLYWPCCVPAYDARAAGVAKATVRVLEAAEISFGILGDGESCCGEAVRRAGAEEVFQSVAGANVAAFREAGVKRTVVTSPHCYRTFQQEYGELGAGSGHPGFEILHQTQLFARLIDEQRLRPTRALEKKVVYHDPCLLGRGCGVFDEPRQVLKSIPGLELVEIPNYSREHSLCCGGGSGGVWLDRPKEERLSVVRVQQAAATGAEILAVACPYCLQMFEDSVKTSGLELEVKDVSELLAEALSME